MAVTRPPTSDALRNFKFIVTIAPPSGNKSGALKTLNRLGFMTVDGLAEQTEVIPYREGGDNTTTRKMPGQTDFGPITLARGAMAQPLNWTGAGAAEMYAWTGLIFSAMRGAGTNTTSGNFRTDMYIDVLQHPVTYGSAAAGVNNPPPVKMRFHVFNAWVMSLSWSGLDAGGNGVLIESAQIAHEGFVPTYGRLTATGPVENGAHYLTAA